MHLRFPVAQVVALFALLMAGNAQAATYTVTTLGDGAGACSGFTCTTLRAAFAAATGTAADDEIVFSDALSGTIELLDSINVFNATGGALTLRGRLDAGGVPEIGLSGKNLKRIFLFNTGNTVLIQNMALKNGLANGGVGGAILSNATLTIENSVLSGNVAGSGGSIYSSGALTLRNSRVVNNAAGTGAGIYVNSSTALIENCVVSGNVASQHGGGIITSGVVTIVQSTLSGNVAAQGAGIHVATANAQAIISRSTLSGNEAGQLGGGIYLALGAVQLAHSTVSANAATHGGGIYSNDTNATLVLEYATLAGNEADVGAGLFNKGQVTLDGSVIADGVGGVDCHRDNGSIAARNSFIGDGLACINGAASGNLSGDPKLGALADNGGSTLTHLPQGSSPLIDAAGACGDEHPFDQRELERPQDGVCDIGAVERTGVRIFSDGFED